MRFLVERPCRETNGSTYAPALAVDRANRAPAKGHALTPPHYLFHSSAQAARFPRSSVQQPFAMPTAATPAQSRPRPENEVVPAVAPRLPRSVAPVCLSLPQTRAPSLTGQ